MSAAPAKVRAGFIMQGGSLRKWCVQNQIDPGYAHHVLKGHTNGPAAQALRQRLIAAASASA